MPPRRRGRRRGSPGGLLLHVDVGPRGERGQPDRGETVRTMLRRLLRCSSGRRAKQRCRRRPWSLRSLPKTRPSRLPTRRRRSLDVAKLLASGARITARGAEHSAQASVMRASASPSARRQMRRKTRGDPCGWQRLAGRGTRWRFGSVPCHPVSARQGTHRAPAPRHVHPHELGPTPSAFVAAPLDVARCSVSLPRTPRARAAD